METTPDQTERPGRVGPSTLAVERDCGAAIVAIRERMGLPNNGAVVRILLLAYAEKSRVNLDETMRRAGFPEPMRPLVERRGWPYRSRPYRVPNLAEAPR